MSVMDATLVFLWLGLMLTWVWGQVAGRIPRIKGVGVCRLSAVCALGHQACCLTSLTYRRHVCKACYAFAPLVCCDAKCKCLNGSRLIAEDVKSQL